jgi:hypothetical protein
MGRIGLMTLRNTKTPYGRRVFPNELLPEITRPLVSSDDGRVYLGLDIVSFAHE